MIQKYEIHGEPKAMPLLTIGCVACKDGEKFKENRYRTDTESDPYFERICGECLTKYKIPYIDLGYDVESYPGKAIYKDSFDEWAQNNAGLLTNDNQAHYTISLAVEFNEQVKEMKIDDVPIDELRDEYELTGKCDHLHWLKSHPFKTFEGSHTIESCAVCKLGQLTYKGKKYQDKLMNLVRYVAHMGVQAEESFREELKLFADIPVVEEQLPSFKIEEELPSFEIGPVF